MNDHDTIDRIRAGLADHHHVRPVDDVLARGRSLRIRRRRPYAVAAVAVVAAAGVTAVVTVGGSTPAFADWSTTPETTPADVVAAIDAGCRSMLDAPVTLAVVDRRGANAVAVYASTRGDYQCTRYQGSGSPGDADWWTQGGTSGPDTAKDPGTAIEVTGTTAGVNVHGGSMTAVSGRVRADVVRVTAAVSGREIDGAIGGARFDVWWPAVGTDDATVTVTAYGADGAPLSTQAVTVPGFGVG